MGERMGHAGTNEQAFLREAIHHLDRNQLELAEKPLLGLLASRPDHPQALQVLGLVRLRQERLADAEDLYRRSLLADPNQPQVHQNLANLLHRLGRDKDSIAAYREALRLKPNYAEAHLNLALAQSSIGDHPGAETSCR